MKKMMAVMIGLVLSGCATTSGNLANSLSVYSMEFVAVNGFAENAYVSVYCNQELVDVYRAVDYQVLVLPCEKEGYQSIALIKPQEFEQIMAGWKNQRDVSHLTSRVRTWEIPGELLEEMAEFFPVYYPAWGQMAT